MNDSQAPTMGVTESKGSDKITKYISLTIQSLSTYCSKAYASRIISANENNALYGLYFTTGGEKLAKTCNLLPTRSFNVLYNKLIYNALWQLHLKLETR
jgi:hypothetical protein